MTESLYSDFTYRHATIVEGFVYPKGYAPYDPWNGVVYCWMKAGGLSRTSDPTNATACYVSGSTVNPSGKYDFKDPKHYSFRWPRPDSDYKKFAETSSGNTMDLDDSDESNESNQVNSDDYESEQSYFEENSTDDYSEDECDSEDSDEPSVVDDFTYRHATIRMGFQYPDGYGPYDHGNGVVSCWLKPGEFSRISDPKNATACYKSGSWMTPKGKSFKDPKHYAFSWPRPDKDYEKFVKDTESYV